MGLTVNRQMAKKSTVNRQKRNIFTVNRALNERAKISRQISFFNLFKIFLNNFLKQFFLFLFIFNFLIFFKQLLIIGLIPVFKYEQNDIVVLKLAAKFVL